MFFGWVLLVKLNTVDHDHEFWTYLFQPRLEEKILQASAFLEILQTATRIGIHCIIFCGVYLVSKIFKKLSLMEPLFYLNTEL